LDIDGILPEIEISKLSLAIFFQGKGITPWEIGWALVAMDPAKNGSNHVEDDGESEGQETDHGTHYSRHSAAVRRWFCGSGLVLGAESALGGGPVAALALGTKIQAWTKTARGWRFGVHWLVRGIIRVDRVRRGAEDEIGGGAVPLRPAGGIING
jgi:hypothetical protein